MAVQRALLVIADIGGYTRFMKVHAVALAHAQDIVARLLEAVIDAAKPRLKLSKLEGDAALFYAPVGDDEARSVQALSRHIAAIHDAFATKRQDLADTRMCNCDPCLQAGKLRLKFVTHVGDVAFQRVHRFTELAGVDVIVVHRLLKNSVPCPEYVLMTEPVASQVDDTLRAHAQEQEEDLEGLGKARTFYVDLESVPLARPEPRARSFWKRLWELVKMNLRSIPFILGAKKPCALYRNMGEATAGKILPPADSIPPPSEIPPAFRV